MKKCETCHGAIAGNGTCWTCDDVTDEQMVADHLKAGICIECGEAAHGYLNERTALCPPCQSEADRDAYADHLYHQD